MNWQKFLNVLCMVGLCASLGAVTACGDDGGDDGETANNAPNNTPNNTPNNMPNNMPNNGTNNDPNNDGPVCGNGTCDDGENEANCPADCSAPIEMCAQVGEPCNENTLDSATLTCVAGADSTNPMEATCHQLCDVELDDADCPRGSFCGELNDGRGICIRSNCTSPFNSAEECAGVGPNGGTCFDAGNDAFYCFQAGALGDGEACAEVGDCGPGLFCLDDTCSSLCENGDDSRCGEQQCLPVLNSDNIGVCGEGCSGFDATPEECGEGQGCFPLTADLGLCQAAGDIPVDGECDGPDTCEPGSLCQRLSEGDPSTCRALCNRSEGFGDDTCPENEICLEINDVAGVCFDGCTPFSPEADNGCTQDGVKTCIAIDDRARGLCLESGDKAAGETCDASESVFGDCQGDLACATDDPDSDEGVCRQQCPTFSSVNDYESGCADGEVCSIFGTAWGICDDDVANPPLAAFEPCPTSGQWCSDDVLCLQVDQQGNNACIPLCRPDRGDADCPSGSCMSGFFEGDAFGLCVQ